LKTDHWFYALFQSAPDLITLLLPTAGTAVPRAAPALGPDAPGDLLYRFDAPELKAVNHRLDGVLWPRSSPTGTPQQPVVLLEVQMHAKKGFKHRLGAQCFRFLQLHPQVVHLAVVVVVPHRRLCLGPAQLPRPLQMFLDEVHWLSLEELRRQSDLDPMLSLLTLPVAPEAELKTSTRELLERRPDLLSAAFTILVERYPHLSREDIMEIATIPAKNLRHTRAAQQFIEEGRQEGRLEGRHEGRHEGEAAVTLRQLTRLCGPLSAVTTARIQALPLLQLESLSDALLDFSGPADLAAWLDQHAG
jgi:predicted transposase YdaD